MKTTIILILTTLTLFILLTFVSCTNIVMRCQITHKDSKVIESVGYDDALCVGNLTL